MGEFSEYFRERYAKNKNSDQVDLMNKQRVKNAILESCETYLQESGESYVFEVPLKDLSYALSAIMEEPIKSRYIISQMSKTLFVAQLRDVEL